MSQENEYYITADGIAKLKAELEELTGPKRVDISERLREAISQGDLSENADYIKAKEDQGFLEGRIEEIKTLLSNVVVIDESKTTDGKVKIGSHVIIQEGDYPSEEYHVVGAAEANPREGRISNKSPIGIAVMGKKEGDLVTVETPGGKLKLKILKVK
ncbi:MAG: transcription elongation factor GreA [Anaerolineales bacterium]|nr:transcription elongation factor GreA [Anaerolineales bacterium]